jgi:hypothetical protein
MILLALSILAGTMAFALPTPHAAALFSGAKSQACGGVKLSDSPSNCADKASSLNTIIGNAVNILSVIVGIVAVVMIIIGGMKFITSNGDASNIASARSTILYAVIGLTVAALAQVLVKYVLFKVTQKP